MKAIVMSLFSLLVPFGAKAEKRSTKMPESVYEIPVKDAKGNEIKLDKYKGHPILIVNVASKCGYTPQIRCFSFDP